MKLSDVMHRNVEVIDSEATLHEAARRMSEADVGVLPVTAGGRLTGMLTDRDIVVRSIARGAHPDETKVADAMTDEVECCYEDDSIDEVSRKMSDRQIQRLVVLNDDDALVGIVSIGDLARARDNAPAAAHALEEIKRPTKPSAAGASEGHAGR